MERVDWVFEGFWVGAGQVVIEPTPGGVLIKGYERISPRRLYMLAPLAERLFLEKRFRAAWESGWRRLRREAATRSEGSALRSQ